ncbi:hypothetical protein BDP55DRAFT_705373 [Colletotrichum godetiae]|uniref:DUF6606 domain-containing protein n=1 Tax=Colletotrichum godetiae TaxID=1209918 RepID=A0AAJ0AH81_9PEZI|nr:uncharacterized protein BDP55DRAFT_705373 [Colletotrichum godetiae]KAK1673834.1 hypothetical protein BDP55DRAFT_705373 [Colletotrichum godetiae]
MDSSLESPAALYGALFNHLAMPAKLPQQRDPENQIHLIESDLVMGELPGNADQCRDVWDATRKTLLTCQHLNTAGHTDKANLSKELHDLGPSGCIVLYIEKQNAGLIIRRAQDPIFSDSVVFEAFEASAKNENVLATKSALLRDFPGIAVAIPFTIFADHHFQSSLATFIEQPSLEIVKDFAAHAFKAGTNIFEYRNIGDSSIITSFLMAILEENGQRIAPVLLRKRVHDDFCWDPTTENIHFLKKKVCRRLVKIDLDRSRSQDRAAISIYDFLFNRLNPTFTTTIDKCSHFFHRAITQKRMSLTKQILPLPRKAPFSNMKLGLRVSYDYVKKTAKDHLSHYARGYHKLINTETKLLASTEDSCLKISQQIFNYTNIAIPLYKGNAVQKSQMLLTVMELWIKMDLIACASFPLMTEFHPLFHPQMLDIARVKKASASRRNIFEDPSPGCFAERLHGTIIKLADDMRDHKAWKWMSKSKEYHDLISRIDASACTYIFEYKPLGRGYHDRDCSRWSMMERAQSMRINIFEGPLPRDPVVARAVIFELACPKEFAAYRDTTWWLLRQLATHFDDKAVLPRYFLRDYLQLKSFWRPGHHKLGLASTTKPFPFPPGRLGSQPLFDLHVALILPKNSSWRTLMDTKAYSLSGPGPSSYGVVASQSSCLPGINNHEYLAMQTLMTGKIQRWIVLLTELASTNLNFSSEVTMLLVTHLVLQSGPQDNSGDILRATHHTFRNESFCNRLFEQIQIRLESLRPKGSSTMIRAHQICLRWVEMLRWETLRTTDTETARSCQQYALWAAILCKRTYIIHVNQLTNLDPLSLRTYIECCITIQDNLVVEVGPLPQVLQHAVVSDMKLSYRLSPLVCKSIASSPDVFRTAIITVWPEADGFPRTISSLQVGSEWVICGIQGHDGWEECMQTVQYNTCTGLLLVDNHPLGRLPKPPEHTEVLTELFGEQALLTRPSDMLGMNYSEPCSQETVKLV